MVYLSDNQPGGDRAWGSFPNFIQLLDDSTITRPLIRVRSILQETCYISLFRAGKLTTTEMGEWMCLISHWNFNLLIIKMFMELDF